MRILTITSLLILAAISVFGYMAVKELHAQSESNHARSESNRGYLSGQKEAESRFANRDFGMVGSCGTPMPDDYELGWFGGFNDRMSELMAARKPKSARNPK